MWSRQELKSNARIMLKANYLKIVIVSVVFALLTSSGYSNHGQRSWPKAVMQISTSAI